MINNLSIIRKIGIILIILFIFVSLNIYAQDAKFPGKINVEFKSQLSSDIIDGEPEQTLNTDSGDIYLRNEMKGKISFKVSDFYSIAPWLKDRIDLKWYQKTYSGVYTDSNGDTVTISDDNVQLKARNRFYIGLDNVFKIPDVMSIGTNFELRLANRLDKNALYVRLTPILYLEGDYDFGLSWSMNNMFEFNLFPDAYVDPIASNNLFQSFCYELDTLNIAFDFFHFFGPEKVKGAFVIDMYVLTTSYAGNVRYDEVVARAPLDYLNNLKLYVGLNFDFFGIKPFFGFYVMFNQYTSADGGTVAGQWPSAIDGLVVTRQADTGLYTEVRPGIKTGCKFKKDWFECGFTYVGCIVAFDSYDSSANFDNDLDDSLTEVYTKAANQYNRFWENSFDAYVKFKL